MGMYTEVVLAVEFRKDTPPEIINWIRYLVNEKDPEITQPVKRPDHPLFRDRKSSAPVYVDLFHGNNGAAFPGNGYLRFEFQDRSQSWHLTIRSALKNYQKEVEALLMFLMPYAEPNGYAGYYRFEGDEYPSLVFYPELDKLKVIDGIGEMITRTNGLVRDLFAPEPDTPGTLYKEKVSWRTKPEE